MERMSTRTSLTSLSRIRKLKRVFECVCLCARLENENTNVALSFYSWGETWGDKGYVKLGRGGKNEFGMCAILKMASFPVVE
jgi:hypothetical protein